MKAIYEPRGRAAEYAPLACNLYRGCTHGCRYCYVPRCLHASKESFHAEVRERRGVLDAFARDAEKLAGDPREILFCFTSDPYPERCPSSATRWALMRAGLNNLRATVLTKAGKRAMRDFDILKEHGFTFGTSLVFIDDELRAKYEPHAAPVAERLTALAAAKTAGLRTWVSVEPVVVPAEALRVIALCADIVDHWKIGKLNHGPHLDGELAGIEREVDWKRFYVELIGTLQSLNADYYIKADLRKAALGRPKGDDSVGFRAHNRAGNMGTSVIDDFPAGQTA